MGNNMNCDSCSVNARNMMHQREMAYQKDMRMTRNQMHNRNMNCNMNCNMNGNSNMNGNCDMGESCVQPRMKEQCDDGCDRNRNRCDDDCSRGRDMLYGVPLAMGYVPWQNFGCAYEPAQALKAGTIFPELDKPFYGRRGVRL